MSLNRRQFALATCSIAAPFTASPAFAAEYPERTVTLISPFAAGGTNDYLTRLMAQRLGEALKGSFVVDNRTGANGTLGASVVAKSPADGHMLLMGNSATHGTNPTLYPDPRYDVVKDFAPVGMVGSVPIVLVVSSALNVNSVAELIAHGKAKPGTLAFGSSGIGGTGHLCGEALKAAAKMDMVHAPYKGDAPAVADVMGGQVAMAFVGIASATAAVQTGKVRMLAVAHPQRVASLPQVPTFAEAGPERIVFSQWYALFARAGTPPATIEKLNAAMKTIIARDDVRKDMATQGAEPTYTTPDELSRFFKAEVLRFREIIQRLDIKAG